MKRFNPGGEVTLVQFVALRFVFCSKVNVLDGMIHETTALVPDNAMCNCGGIVFEVVKMLPSCTSVARKPPSADDARELYPCDGAALDVQVAPPFAEVRMGADGPPCPTTTASLLPSAVDLMADQ